MTINFPPYPFESGYNEKRYLPTAFDGSLTLLEKVDKILYWLHWLNDQNQSNDNTGGGTTDPTSPNPTPNEYFDISELDAEFVMHLNGIRNAVNQSINIDMKTGCIYTTQSDSKTPEGFYINKLSPSGDRISSMLIDQGGHGTTIGLDNMQGDNLKIWFYHLGIGKLVCVDYADDSVLDMATAANLPDFTPLSLAGQYITPTVDQFFDYMSLRTPAGRVEIRSRGSVVNHVDNVLFYADIDPNEMTSDTTLRPMQGVTTYGSTIYWQSGSSSNVMKIQAYNGETHSKIKDVDFPTLMGERGYLGFRDNFHEPEGLFFFVNPQTGKQSLIFAISTGGITKRYSVMYALNEIGAKEYFDATSRLGTQLYPISKGMRTLSVPDGITRINDLLKPGHYYIDNTTAKTFVDFPYPVGDAGWFVENSFTNQTLDLRQKIIRSSSTNKILVLERVITLDRETFLYSYGDWTVHQTGNRHAENVEPVDWNYKISNINFPQEYYLSTADLTAMTDAPYNDAGARLIVHPADSDNRILQELIRNSDSVMETYYRNVNSDGTANAWFGKRLTGGGSYSNITTSAGVTQPDPASVFRVTDDGTNLITRGAITIPATITTVTTFATFPNGIAPNARWDYEQKNCVFSFLSDGTVQVVNNSGADQTIRLGCIIPKS